jgi:capsular polysaccharide biosynthesis protein
MLLYGLGPILGIIIAFGFSLLAEALDHTLRSPVDVEKHLGKPVLAVIPKMKNNKAAKALTGGSQGTISS